MRTLIIILLALILHQDIYAQKEGRALTDSLYEASLKMKDDTNKVRQLAMICYYLRYINPKASIKPGLEALSLGIRLKYPYGIGLSHYALGWGFDFTGRTPESIDHFMKAQAIFEKLKENNLLCATNLALAWVYFGFDSAVIQRYRQTGQALLPLNTDPVWKIRNFGSLGMLYKSVRKFDSAGYYLSTALTLAKENHYNSEIRLLNERNGILLDAEGKFDSALIIYKILLEKFKALGEYRLATEMASNIGSIMYQKSSEKGVPGDQRLAEAEEYFKEALRYADKIEYKSQILNANLYLSRIYIKKGKADSAFNRLLTAYQCYTSLNSIENINKKTILSYKYEKEIKEQQFKLLKLQNRQQLFIIIAAVAGLCILVIVVILIFSNRKKMRRAYLLVNKQKEEIESTLDKLKQTQSQLIQAEKMASLGMLTAGIAHEINNPVNFINSGAISLYKDYEELQQFIQSLEQRFPGAQKFVEEKGIDELMKIIPQTVDDIKVGINRTSEIIKGLRNFTRLDTSELKDADLHEGLESTFLLLSSKISNGITVVKEFDKRIGLIKCYPGPLNQVFMNLVNNAIDAIDQRIKKNPADSGQYQIGITTKLMDTGLQKQVKIVVSDTGSGIPDGIKDKLFDPFFTTKDVGKGTGLGLSICHGIIEKHGGNIAFESKVNEGSTFTVMIPVA